MMKSMKYIATLGIQLYGNDAKLLRGVLEYARGKPDWLVSDGTDHSMGKEDAPNPAAVIGHVLEAGVQEYLQGLGVPVVNLASPLSGVDVFPRVVCDDVAIGRVAAEHLLERGLRHFGYFTVSAGLPFSRGRGLGFRAELEEGAFECELGEFALNASIYSPVATPQPEHQPVVAWLRSIPKPCGVLACRDRSGRLLCGLAREAGFRVPEDVAVVGVDDFDLVCETSVPPLSSVQIPAQRIGYRAAEILDRMMAGKRVRKLTELPPGRVHVRQSSDVIAIEDRVVADALRFIRTHFMDGINATDLVRHMRVDRRVLERHFKEALGRSPLREIHRVMGRHAVRLLEGSPLPVDEVARQSGFRDATHISRVFRRLYGRSPRDFRREPRPSDRMASKAGVAKRR